MAYKIAVANCKGGVTKTATALNLMDQLMERGYRVLFVDCDPQEANSTGIFGATYEDVPTLDDLLVGKYKAEDCIQKTKYGDIIPCDPILDNAPYRIPVSPKMYDILRDKLSLIDDKYDFIIIDTPPAKNILTGNAINSANGIVIPFVCDGDAMKANFSFKKYVDQFKELNPSLKILGTLRVLYKPNELLTKSVDANLPQMEKLMGAKTFNTTIRSCSKVKQANTMGLRLSQYDNKNKAYEDYSKLTDEILEEVKE